LLHSTRRMSSLRIKSRCVIDPGASRLIPTNRRPESLAHLATRPTPETAMMSGSHDLEVLEATAL